MLHDTFLLVAFDGEIVAVKDFVSPTIKEQLAGSRETLETEIGSLLGVYVTIMDLIAIYLLELVNDTIISPEAPLLFENVLVAEELLNDWFCVPKADPPTVALTFEVP